MGINKNKLSLLISYYKNNSICGIKKLKSRTSLVVQWLRLCTPKAGAPGSIPAQGTRSHVPQLRVHMPLLRPGAAK